MLISHTRFPILPFPILPLTCMPPIIAPSIIAQACSHQILSSLLVVQKQYPSTQGCPLFKMCISPSLHFLVLSHACLLFPTFSSLLPDLPLLEWPSSRLESPRPVSFKTYAGHLFPPRRSHKRILSPKPSMPTLIPQRAAIARTGHLMLMLMLMWMRQMRLRRWEHPPLRLALASSSNGTGRAGAECAEVDVGYIVAAEADAGGM